jgi:hypothetical protein
MSAGHFGLGGCHPFGGISPPAVPISNLRKPNDAVFENCCITKLWFYKPMRLNCGSIKEVMSRVSKTLKRLVLTKPCILLYPSKLLKAEVFCQIIVSLQCFKITLHLNRAFLSQSILILSSGFILQA